jgi:hypothetical protein
MKKYLLALAILLTMTVTVQAADVAVPLTPANYDDSLASRILASDTSMTLVAGEDRAGNSLVGFTCFTIDEGQPTLEYVCGTASSTAVTSLTRGLGPQNPNSTSSALAHVHRRGANVKITDFPFAAFVQRLLNGLDSFASVLKYSSSISTSTIGASNQNLANVAYVNSVQSAGAADANETTKGLSQLATGTELAAGTATGTTGAYLVAPAMRFNASSTATRTIPVTNTDGKLDQGFLRLNDPFTFSAGVTSSATTTLSGTNTIISGSLSAATTTFSVIPTAPTSTPSSSSSLITLHYLTDFNQVLVNTSISTTTNITSYVNLQSAATTTFSLARGQRVMLTVAGKIQNDTNGEGAAVGINIDGVDVDDLAAFDGSNGGAQIHSGGFTYITGVLSAGSHTIRIRGKVIGAGIATFTLPQVAIMSLGQ